MGKRVHFVSLGIPDDLGWFHTGTISPRGVRPFIFAHSLHKEERSVFVLGVKAEQEGNCERWRWLGWCNFKSPCISTGMQCPPLNLKGLPSAFLSATTGLGMWRPWGCIAATYKKTWRAVGAGRPSPPPQRLRLVSSEKSRPHVWQGWVAFHSSRFCEVKPVGLKTRYIFISRYIGGVYRCYRVWNNVHTRNWWSHRNDLACGEGPVKLCRHPSIRSGKERGS